MPETETVAKNHSGGGLPKPILLGVAFFIAVCGLVLLSFYLRPGEMGQIIKEHFRAVIGIPVAALSAFCILSVFEVQGGQIEFEALGVRFRGGSGPAVIWIFAFLAIVGSIRLLW